MTAGDVASCWILGGHRPPLQFIIFVMLFGLAFASSLLAGYGMAKAQRRSFLHMIAFAGVMAISVYVVLDMEFPQLGLAQ